MTKLFAKEKYESLFAKKEEKTIRDYQEIIRLSQAKILELQAKCNHLTHEVHMYMWRPGAMVPQRICSHCDAVIPGVTEEETRAAWDKWNSDFSFKKD